MHIRWLIAKSIISQRGKYPKVRTTDPTLPHALRYVVTCSSLMAVFSGGLPIPCPLLHQRESCTAHPPALWLLRPTLDFDPSILTVLFWSLPRLLASLRREHPSLPLNSSMPASSWPLPFGPFPSPPSPAQVSTSLFHTMAVTASGDTLGCGQNDEGQVRPDQPSEAFFPRPSLVEPVLNHRVTQASVCLFFRVLSTRWGSIATEGRHTAAAVSVFFARVVFAERGLFAGKLLLVHRYSRKRALTG